MKRTAAELAAAGYEVHYYVPTYLEAYAHARTVAEAYPGRTKFVKARQEVTFNDRPGRIVYFCQDDIEHLTTRPLAVVVAEGVGASNAIP